MLAKRNAEIRKGADALYMLSADPDVRAKYEAREKAWRDRAAQLDDAFEDGREKERGNWQIMVADMDAENERLRLEKAGTDVENERLRSANADKDTEIERLLAQVVKLQAKALE